MTFTPLQKLKRTALFKDFCETNYFITLVKEVVLSNALKKGDDIYYYLVDCEGRKAMLVFLDEKERPLEKEVGLKLVSF